MIHGVFIRAPACSSPTNSVCVFCVPIFTCVFTCVCFLSPTKQNPKHTPSREARHITVGRVHPLESISWQAERNYSALSFIIGSLRSSISHGKVGLLMFLRLNRLFIPEVKVLHDAIEANKAAAARCKEKVAQVEGAMANTALALTYESIVLWYTVWMC